MVYGLAILTPGAFKLGATEDGQATIEIQGNAACTGSSPSVLPEFSHFRDGV